jgi:hypothetical protein
MEANVEKLYSELRKTKTELMKTLNNSLCSPEIKTMVIEELNDVEVAMGKMATGTFGTCEISGELIPKEVLEAIPTIKTIYDIEYMGNFFRKPIDL